MHVNLVQLSIAKYALMPIFVRDVNLDLDLHGVLANLVFLQTVIYALLIIIDASLVHLHMESSLCFIHV